MSNIADLDSIDFKSFSRYVKLNGLLGSNINSNVLYDLLISIKNNIVCRTDILKPSSTRYTYTYNDIIIVLFHIHSSGGCYYYNIDDSFYNLFIKYYEIEYDRKIPCNISLFIYEYIKKYLGIDEGYLATRVPV